MPFGKYLKSSSQVGPVQWKAIITRLRKAFISPSDYSANYQGYIMLKVGISRSQEFRFHTGSKAERSETELGSHGAKMEL